MMVTPRHYRDHMLEYLDARYSLGHNTPEQSDCSGMFRALFKLDFKAKDFYERIFIHDEGSLGAAFWTDHNGDAYHMAPLIGHNVVLNLSTNGARFMSIETEHCTVRYL